MNDRRQFLQSALGGCALISVSAGVPRFLLQASAQTWGDTDEKILLVVQLSGGNDGLNTVIPFGDDAYYQNRFTLAIPENKVLNVDDHVGLHPALRGFADLLEQNCLAIVQGVGYPNPNRSHFESMDLWHTAHRTGSSVPLGWLGRLVEDGPITGDLPAIHFGPEEQPLALATRTVPVPSIKSLESFRLEAGRDRRLRDPIRNGLAVRRAGSNSLLGFIHDSTNMAIATSQRLEEVLQGDDPNSDYPQTNLGAKLRAIGRLIDAGLKTRIYYVTIDGFDTHSNQAEAHQGLLAELGDATRALLDDLRQQGNDQRVLVMTFSEFGRRVRENASRGTDHGTAAPMFLAGARVRSGLIGGHPSLTDLDQGDLKFLTDYRQVYAAVCRHWLGIDAAAIVGPDYRPIELFS